MQGNDTRMWICPNCLEVVNDLDFCIRCGTMRNSTLTTPTTTGNTNITEPTVLQNEKPLFEGSSSQSPDQKTVAMDDLSKTLPITQMEECSRKTETDLTVTPVMPHAQTEELPQLRKEETGAEVENRDNEEKTDCLEVSFDNSTKPKSSKKWIVIGATAVVVVAVGIMALLGVFHRHEFSEWKVTQLSTCTVEGIETRVCECGETESRAIPLIEHTYGKWKVARDSTCAKEGEEERFCEVCNHRATKSIAKKAHKFGEWKVTKQPTCTKEGIKEKECVNCKTRETASVAMIPH